MNNRYTPEEVDYKFGDRNHLSEEFRCRVSEAIAELPEEIVDWVSGSGPLLSLIKKGANNSSIRNTSKRKKETRVNQ